MRTANLLPALLAVAALALSTGCALDARPAVDPAASADILASEASGLETFTSDAAGFDTHSYWLDTGREVVVFDAQFTEAQAQRLLAEIHARTESPVRWVVVTHPNPDKFNGARVFQRAGAKVVASASTARAIPGVHAYKKGYFVDVAHMFTEATYPAEASIDVTFTGAYDLPLEGATKVRLHELAHRGVSSTQTVAFIPRLDALVVGDLVHHKAHAWLEGGIVDGKPVPDLASWSLALDELSALVKPTTTVYGGRGEPAKLDVAVRAQQAYLRQMNELVTRYVADLGAQKSELAGPEAGKHYKKIAALAGEAFPDYALGYMIEYGVYGLVQQIASR